MKLKNFISGLVAVTMICSILQCNVSANSNDEILLSNAYSSMEKAVFNSTSYGWEEIEKAERIDFTDGVLGGKIKDFDNDGALELLTVKLVNSDDSDEYSDIYAKAYMEMYEVADSSVQLSANTDSFTVITSFTDAGGLECFTKDNYIVLECATQNNTFADGALQDINIYSYNGQEFVNEISINFGGSYVSFEDNEIPEKLRSLGFVATAEYFGEEYFNPYFISDSENNANLAKLEKDIEPIAELLITNNISNIIEEYSDASDLSSLYADNAIMTIEINDFSSIEKPISVILNGNVLAFDVQPYIEKGTTKVPMRAIFEALGAEVNYDTLTKTVTAVKGDTTIQLVQGAETATVNGNEIALSATADNINGTIMVPLRFVSESFGADVQWDNETKTVYINLLAE